MAPAPARANPGRAGTPTAEEVVEALRETLGNVVCAADRLGTHPRQVYRWIERYALNIDDYRG